MKLETTLRDSIDGPYQMDLKPLTLEGIWLTNQMGLVTAAGTHRELTNPIIGRDFVAGLLEDRKTTGYFRKSTLRQIELLPPNDSSVALCFSRKTLAEQLQLISYPRLATLTYRESKSTSGNFFILGVARGFMISDQIYNPAIPIAALSQVEI